MYNVLLIYNLAMYIFSFAPRSFFLIDFHSNKSSLGKGTKKRAQHKILPTKNEIFHKQSNKFTTNERFFLKNLEVMK